VAAPLLGLMVSPPESFGEGGSDDHDQAKTFAAEGNLEISGALAPGTAATLLAHVNRQFARHMSDRRKADEQLKLRIECEDSLLRIFPSLDGKILGRTLDNCAPT